MADVTGQRRDAMVAGALAALRHRWPEYLIEAAGLRAFMVSACVFAALLEHPGSPVHTVAD